MKYSTWSVSRRTALTLSSFAALTLAACSGQPTTSDPTPQPTTAPPNESPPPPPPPPPPLSHHYAGDTHLPRGEHHSNRPTSTVDELHRQQTALGTDVGHRGTGEHPRTRPDTR